MEGGGCAGQHRVMQNETPKTSTAATFGRSSIARLPPELREAVDAAIADGATIDEIADLIRGESGACSRSAVGRYTKNVRDLIRRQQETDHGIEMWVRALGERTEGRAGLILIETLRTMTLSTMAEFAKSGEPVPTQELARLSLILKRIEGTDKLRLQRERAAAKEAKAAAGAGQAPGQAPPRKGLSPETVDIIDEAVVGFRFRPRPPVSSAPVDPWNPSESRESQLIPLNPGESRPENVSDVSRPGPAAVRNSPPKARGAPCHVMAGPARTGSGYPAIHRAAHPSRGMTEGDARNKSGHDEEGGPVGWIASPSMQTATACSPSPPLIHFPQAPGARSARLATRIRARRSRAVRAGSQLGPPLPVLSRLVHFPQRRALRTCGSAHLPLSPLRPLGPEKEKGADTAFGPPPPFSGEGNRGSWAGLPSGPAFEGYEREDARAGYRRYGPPGASRRGPSLTQRTMADAGACSADVSFIVHN